MFRFRPESWRPWVQSARGPFAVMPGVVWGDYPERAESKAEAWGIARWFERVEPRVGGLRQIGPMARSCAARAARYAERFSQSPQARAERLDLIRLRLMRGGLGAEPVSHALAWVAWRIRATLGIELHGNQYECALHLLNQSLAEMATGEGKTLSAAAAAAVVALAGAPVHVLTANDYLAARDADELRPLFEDLGLTVGSALEAQSLAERRERYRADIVYATARTVAFDYLRDRLTRADGLPHAHHDEHALQAGEPQASKLLLRGLCCAIVDEADSILLDEARTPLIIADSQNDPGERGRLWQALDLARQLTAGEGFRVSKSDRQVVLTPAGHETIEKAAQAYGGAWKNRIHRQELVTQALTALHLLTRDVDYIVRDREVVIVDPTTGRTAEGRQWSMGLHALVALKEKLPLPLGSRTLASLTYPRLFSRYHHLCGLSGTLSEERGELKSTYGLAIARIERHRPLARKRAAARCFRSRADQFAAARQRAIALADQGRAVLIATDSVEDSRALAREFEAIGRAVPVLDATQSHDEALTIAAAGQAGCITIATQIAGRGTDIRLGDGVAQAGGLHVLSLQLSRSARIDRQIEGRCARQGDPGSSEHWIRLEGSPLSGDDAPAVLKPALAVLAPWASRIDAAGEPEGGPHRRLAAVLLLRLYQRYCRSEDALSRQRVLRNDQDWSNRLHFATIVE